MELIFLHGPPAAGKFSIAMELSARFGCRVFHNHLTLDVAKSLFEFDTEPFWDLVRELRGASVRAAATHGIGTVIYTACYDHPTDLPELEEIEQIVARFGGRVRHVYLKCSVPELEKRVTAPSRTSMGKLRTVQGLREALAKWHFGPVPRADCVTITTDGQTVSQTADEIAAQLSLGPWRAA